MNQTPPPDRPDQPGPGRPEPLPTVEVAERAPSAGRPPPQAPWPRAAPLRPLSPAAKVVLGVAIGLGVVGAVGIAAIIVMIGTCKVFR